MLYKLSRQKKWLGNSRNSMFMLCYGFKTLTRTNVVHGNSTDVLCTWKKAFISEYALHFMILLQNILLLIKWKETVKCFRAKKINVNTNNTNWNATCLKAIKLFVGPLVQLSVLLFFPLVRYHRHRNLNNCLLTIALLNVFRITKEFILRPINTSYYFMLFVGFHNWWGVAAVKCC